MSFISQAHMSHQHTVQVTRYVCMSLHTCVHVVYPPVVKCQLRMKAAAGQEVVEKHFNLHSYQYYFWDPYNYIYSIQFTHHKVTINFNSIQFYMYRIVCTVYIVRT